MVANEEKLYKLLIMVEQMAKKLSREEQHQYKKEISKLREENESARKENEQINVENENTRKEMQTLNRRVDYLEKVNKQNNVIVSEMRINDQE